MPLNILHLEDDPFDGELVESLLADDGLEPRIQRVATKAAFGKALKEDDFDLILSDFSMPGYDGGAALEASLKQKAHIPFIFVSGKIGEELAIECLKRGATDYVLKSRLERLAPCVRRALREKAETNARLKVESELKDSLLRLETTFQNVSVGIVEVSPDGHWLKVNQRFCDMVGYTSEELQTMTFRDVTHPDDVHINHTHGRKIQVGELSYYLVNKRYIRKTGEVVWVNVTISQVSRSTGELDYFISVIEDITARRVAEDATIRVQERLQLLGEVSARLLAAEEPSRVVNDLCLKVMNHLGCDVYNYFLADEAGRRLWRQGCEGIPQELCKEVEVVPYGGGICGFVAEERRLLMITATEAMDNMQWSFVERLGIQIYICHPLLAGTRLMGTLAFGSRSRSGFQKDELDLLTAVADQVALALERKQTADILRSSEERFRMSQQVAKVGTFEWDIVTGRSVWSQGLESLYGLAPGTFGGTHADWEARVHPEDWPEVLRRVEESMATGSIEGEWRVCWPDESVHWLETRGWVFKDENGKPLRMLGAAFDISERKAAEEALRRANGELEQRVAERTWELLQANRELRDEVSERQRLEQTVLQIAEYERRSVGQDLHDGLCQELTGLSCMTQALSDRLRGKEMAKEADRLNEITDQLRSSANETREVAKGLHPVELDSEGLITALYHLAEQTSQRRPCQFRSPQNLEIRDNALALNLYRIAQEAVNNAVKHSGAKDILITLAVVSGYLTLEVIDDGAGLPKDKPKSGGMGLQLMNYRASMIGGIFFANSRPEGGTTVTCKVPLGPEGKFVAPGWDLLESGSR